MSGEQPEILDQAIKITDPGEVDRDQHMWGDRLMIHVGNITAWLFPILMVAIVTQVVIRKMGMNQAWLDDAQWWMYGFAMLVGFGYAITTSSHVRVDILHQNYSPERKARIEVFALGWLLLPFLVIMTDIMIHYGYSSWKAGEGSDSPNGLHMLYLLKMSMPVLFTFAGIAAWSVMVRNLAKIYEPKLWRMMLAALPAVWFCAERIVHYALFWYVRISQPDINPRRISREPIMEWSTLASAIIILAIFVIAFALAKRSTAKG